MSKNNITTIHHLRGEKAAQDVNAALVHFPSYLLFCTGEPGGFVTMYSPTVEMEDQLKAQIVRSFKQDPRLFAFFQDVISKM